MPWKVSPMSEIRLTFVHHVLSLRVSVAEACDKFGISRKTGYKWLNRHREDPDRPLSDQTRRPHASPAITPADMERRILNVRAEFGWGARKIHAYLQAKKVRDLPSSRTVGNILQRNGCIKPKRSEPEPIQFFERTQPHQLWQCDHKGPIEVGRRKVHPLTVLDDHSRFLLALRPCEDLTMKTAFDVLWNTFGEFGMPESLLCDNAFSTAFQVPKTVSWFDSQLILLGIQPIHGRPYHPQTQGKVERIHGTLEREVWPHVRRDTLPHFTEDINRWRTNVYNVIRPHEALGDKTPISRFHPSPRPRPSKIPDVEYPPGSITRKVSTSGDIRWRGCRILAGRGLVGQFVRIEETDHEIAVYFASKQVRGIAHDQLKPGTML